MHTMLLNELRSEGWEEWICPQCGRRMLLCWSPPGKIVTAEGSSPNEVHHAAKSYDPPLPDGEGVWDEWADENMERLWGSSV